MMRKTFNATELAGGQGADKSKSCPERNNVMSGTSPDKMNFELEFVRTSPDNKNKAERVCPDKDPPFKGVLSGQTRPEISDVVLIGQMIGTLDRIVSAGFDGAELRSQLVRASESLDCDRVRIMAEVVRCREWCDGLTGPALAKCAEEVFSVV